MRQIANHPFISTPGARAAIDDSTRLARVWVANRAISNAIRALAHESLAADPSQTVIRLGADEARAVYALALTAATEADMDPVYKGALTGEGLPVGADALGSFAGSGKGDKSLGNYWVKPTDFMTAMQLQFDDAPESRSIPVALSSEFRETLHATLQAEAERALQRNPELSASAQAAADRAESCFLRGGYQVRHGGRFRTPARQRSDLSSTELIKLARQRQSAQIGVAFGFGQVFGQSQRHGAGWGPL